MPILTLSCGPLAPLFAAVRGDEVMYVGGTMQQIPDKSEGKLTLESMSGAEFSCKKGQFTIPYKSLHSLEYGQKAGRRLGVALVISPIALLSKKRKHFLSVGFEDAAGTKQGAVFELAKGRTHSVITTLEARSGKKVEFESEDARKHYEKEGR
ncbi:MAG: hypothetical protein J0L64_19830 [Acidobacteria bacterium]|nr:hypothetical protein [Acidobacteriota bacterium]